MSIFSRIKAWFTGGSSKKETTRRTTTSRANRVTNYGGGGYRSSGSYSSSSNAFQEAERRRKQQQEKREKTTNALASIAKNTAGTANRTVNPQSGQQRVMAKVEQKAKFAPPDPKEKARQNARNNARNNAVSTIQSAKNKANDVTKKLDSVAKSAERSLNKADEKLVKAENNLKQRQNNAPKDPKETLRKQARAKRDANRAEWEKVTNGKYDVNKNGTKARIAQKSQTYSAEEEKLAMKQHPVMTSAGRGALSGVTFGGSELMAQGSKNRRKSGAEEYYQQNKSKGAEMAGELAGSLASFGLTGGASAKAVGKVAPKAVTRLGERGAERLASRAMIRRAAEKEAFKRFGVGGATRDVIEQIARRRATEAMSELGKDTAINLTTGLASDLSHSYLDATQNGEFDLGQFGRSMGGNALMNLGLGGATSLVPAFRVGRNVELDDVAKNLVDSNREMRESFIRNADEADSALDRAFTLQGDTPRIAEGRLPANEINTAGAPTVPMTPQNVRLASEMRQRNYMPEYANRLTLQDMVNVQDSRVADIERELDSIQNRIRDSRMFASDDELMALTDRFDELMAQRNALLNGNVADDVARNAEVRAEAPAEAPAPVPTEAPARAPYEPPVETRDIDLSRSVDNPADREALESELSALRARQMNLDPTQDADEYLEVGSRISQIERGLKLKEGESIRIADQAEIEARKADAEEARKKRAKENAKPIDNKKNKRGKKKAEVKAEEGAEPPAPKKGKGKGEKKDPLETYKNNRLKEKPDAKFGDKGNYDLNDDETAKLLIRKKQLEDKKLTLKEKGKAWKKADAELKEVEQALEGKRLKTSTAPDKVVAEKISEPTIKDTEVKGEVKATETPVETKAEVKAEATAEPKAEVKAEQPKAPERIEDMAQIGGDEAQELGIVSDAKISKNAEGKADLPPVKKGKGKKSKYQKAQKNVQKFEGEEISPSVGSKLSEKAGEKVGVKVDAEVKPPKREEVVDIERTYNQMQGGKKKNVLSRGAVTSMRQSLTDESRSRIKMLVKESRLNYDRITNVKKMEDMASQFHSDPEHWAKQFVSYANNLDNMPASQAVDTKYMAKYVQDYTGRMLDKNPNDVSIQLLHDASVEVDVRLSSMSGQIQQIQGVYAKCQPMSRRRTALNTMVDMLDKSIGVRKKGVTIDGKRVKLSTNKEARRKELIRLIEGDERAGKALDAIGKAKTQEEFDTATADLLESINGMKTRTVLDYIQQWRYAGMLGNPKTLIRNRWGNAQFSGIRQFSNAVGALIEDNLAKNGSDFYQRALADRTRGGIDLNIRRQSRIKGEKLTDADAIEAYKAWKEAEKSLTSAGKYENRQGGAKTHNPLVKALDFWSEAVSGRLEKDDAIALERNFREAYMKGAKKLKANGRDLTDPAVKELLVQRAKEEAQIATFREYNEFSTILNKYTNALYDPDASISKRAVAFGVNATIPFAKTPANILRQSMNYSPIGVFKGFRNIKKAAAEGNAELLFKAIDDLSSGLTGTGIAVAGYMLGRTTDAFTTNAGSNDYDAKFEKAQGVQNYSVKFKDPITGKVHSYTLDWLVPTSTTFFAGVELANQLKNTGQLDILEATGNLGQITSRLIEPVIETSMLSGIYNIIDDLRGNTSSGDDKLGAVPIVLREIGQSYLNSLVPTLVGQTARTAYKSDKMLTGVDDNEYFINSLKNKMGLANTDLITDRLGADTDVYGEVKNEKKNAKDYMVSALKNFVLPTNIQEVDIDEIGQAKLDEYRRRVKNGEDPEDLKYLFPKKQYKKNFTIGDTNVEMSNTDLSAYNQAKTTGGEEGMRYILENVMFNRPVYDANGKKVLSEDAYTKEQKAQLMQQFKGKSMRDVEKWLYAQPEFKNASEAEKRKAINGLWTYSSQGKANASKRVGEQAVIKAQGGDVNEYNFMNEVSEKKQVNLLPAIEAGIITYEEAVDFARNAGKTYYYENDEGGQAQTYFNKKQMIEYLQSKGYSYEKAEALFNAFKASNAKPYNGSSGSGRRYYRRRRYRRRRGGGGSSAKAKVPTPKTIKASQLQAGKALVSSGTKSAVKNATPKLERVKAKIDLPDAKW